MRNKKVIIGIILAIVLASLAAASGVLAQTVVPAQPVKTDLVLMNVPGSYLDEVRRGENNLLYMEIKNNGTNPVTNIRFSSTGPDGWVVNITPQNIAALGAGSSQTIDVNIIPASNADRGNYNVTILADASETRAANTSYLRVRESSPLWLWIGGGIAAVVVTVFIIIFLRSGR